jgi:hypothetical protein
MTAFCQHCGQPLLQQDEIPLTPLKGRILARIRRRPGVSAEVLRGLVWADDPNGGPEDRKVLHVHINQANHARNVARRHRRSGERIARAQRVLQAMRAGAALHLQQTPGGAVWTLSTGEHVAGSVAHLVTTSASVVGVGDCLFESGPSQTWRWWNHRD